MRIFIIAILSAIGVAGCATMSENECASADWYSVGHQDGAEGRSLDTANQRGAACNNHGYRMNHARYRQGRDAGLALYCTPTRGYDLGAAGRDYNGVCIGHDEATFVSAYREGRELFSYTSAVARARADVADAEAGIRKAKKRFRKLNDELQEGVPVKVAKSHMKEIVDVQVRQAHLERTVLPDARAELKIAERDLDRYRYELSLRARDARGAASPLNASFTQGDAPSSSTIDAILDNRDRNSETSAEAMLLDFLETARRQEQDAVQ